MATTTKLTLLRQKITYMSNLVAKSSITPPIVAEIMNLLADLDESIKELVDSSAASLELAMNQLETKLTALCAKSVSVASFGYILDQINEGDTITYAEKYTGSQQLMPPAIVYYTPDKRFYGAQVAYAVDSNKATYTFYESFPGEEKCMDGDSPKTDSLYVDSNNQLFFFKDTTLTSVGITNDELETVMNAVDTLNDFTAEIRSIEDHDLAFADESGNVVFSVTDGHIRTKEFDSSNIAVEQPVKSLDIPEPEEGETQRPEVDGATFVTDGDLAIADERGNIVALFDNGHIRTKNFDSADFDENTIRKQDTNGLKISFLGDSITTFYGFIPEGYLKYYPSGDVTAVTLCYWHKLLTYLGMTLGVNASWSGSFVTGNTYDTTGHAGCSDARISALGTNGTPDVIVVFIGINDFDEGKPLGNYTAEDPWTTEEACSTFSLAYGRMLQKLMVTYPKARIFACTLMDAKFKDADGAYPTVRADGAKLSDFNAVIRSLVTAYGLHIVDFHSCGIHWGNMAQMYADSELHPNAAGHDLMFRCLKSAILSTF